MARVQAVGGSCSPVPPVEHCSGMALKQRLRGVVVGEPVLCILLAAVGAALPARSVVTQTAAKPFAAGVVLPDVPGKADPTQTFALYLPSTYSPGKRWPVIYAFDWAGRGEDPVELLASEAEKRGYIVLGSNSSHNGSAREALSAALALWQDSRARFWIDPNQSYATGFSGAARNAFVFADQCGCVQGVIAAGAGLPPLAHPLEGLPYGVFMTLGTYDFNYPELVALEQQLDALHVPNRLRRFEGEHQWPPAEVMAEAVDWLQLEAMQQGRRPKDDAFVAEMRARSLERAHEDEQAGEVISAYEEYRKSAEEFRGLADTTEFGSRAAAIKSSPELRKDEKQQQEDLARQRRMVDGIEQELTSLPSGSYELGQRLGDITPAVAEVRDFAKHAKNPRDIRVGRRAVNDLFATAYEAGLGQMRDGQAAAAELYFQVAAEITPAAPSPQLELAKVYIKMGDKKRALRALELAAAKGLKKTSLLTDSPELAVLRGEPRFQALVRQVESKR
jgi:predicted esterase